MTESLAHRKIALMIGGLPAICLGFDSTGQWPCSVAPVFSVDAAALAERGVDATIAVSLAECCLPAERIRPRIEGDVGVALAFATWMRQLPVQLRARWMQTLEACLGVQVSQRLSDTVDAVCETVQAAGSRMGQYTREYCYENWVPLPQEIRVHTHAVWECRLAAERLEARIVRLEGQYLCGQD